MSGILSDLEKEIFLEFPYYKRVKKSGSLLMKVVDIFLKVITFGQMKDFMRSFITTVGWTVYTPSDWDQYLERQQCEILRHERVHMRQAEDRGRFLFSLMYIALPFPTLFAYYRMKFEQEAYEESMRAVLEYFGKEILLDPLYRSAMIEHFTTSQYFWTWPWKGRIEKWYDATVARLLASQ